MKYFTWQSLPQSRICVWGLSRYQFARDWVGFQGMEFSVLKLRKFCANQSKLATPHLTQWPLNKENQSWLVSSCAQQPAPLGSATFAVAPWGEGGGVVKSQEDACASTRAHARTHTHLHQPLIQFRLLPPPLARARGLGGTPSKWTDTLTAQGWDTLPFLPTLLSASNSLLPRHLSHQKA